jgi:hypothetical protein
MILDDVNLIRATMNELGYTGNFYNLTIYEMVEVLLAARKREELKPCQS